jgi:predicted transcriptional regulator
MAGEKKDDFGLLKKFSCSTCLAVMESLGEESRLLHEIAASTKVKRKEVSNCLKFAEENLLVEKCGADCYALSSKGKEALKRFKEISPLICEP